MQNHSNLIIKALRKYYGSTQVEFSDFLGVSQGALSKIEAGKLEISALQWITICDQYKINPDSLFTGVVNADSSKSDQISVNKNFRAFKVPQKYSLYAESTIRTVYPFIKFLETKVGKKKTNDFLISLGMKPEYFVVLDNPINLVFINDVVTMLIEKNYLSAKNLAELFKHFPIEAVHSYVIEDVKYSANLNTALVKFISRIGNHYERNTSYEFIGEKNCFIQARDYDHVKELDLTSEFKSFRRTYNAKYFENLSNKMRPETIKFTAKKEAGGWNLASA